MKHIIASFVFICMVGMIWMITSCGNKPIEKRGDLEFEYTVQNIDSFEQNFKLWLGTYFRKNGHSYAFQKNEPGYIEIKGRTIIVYEDLVSDVAGDLPFQFTMKTTFGNGKIKIVYADYKVTNNQQSKNVTEQYSEEWLKTYLEKINQDLLNDLAKR